MWMDKLAIQNKLWLRQKPTPLPAALITCFRVTTAMLDCHASGFLAGLLLGGFFDHSHPVRNS